MKLPFTHPLEPMLAKASVSFPSEDEWIFEPKWDGFRALIFRDDDALFIQSRGKKPLLRYFPELREPLLDSLPKQCVLDGEIVIALDGALDFGALQNRLHPAASYVDRFAAKTPASFVAFDVLATHDDVRDRPMVERRALLEALCADWAPPLHLTPATTDVDVAKDWFVRYEGAGLDGVIAKKESLTYQPKKRAMIKLKHRRSADCVVAGFRWHKKGPGTLVGSLMLGLYKPSGELSHVGVTSSFTMARRAELVEELAPLRLDADAPHPWKYEDDEAVAAHTKARRPMPTSRWNPNKSLAFEPLRAERVVEVRYDHMESGRFRHSPTFVRWRTDREPASCGFDQLETTPPFEISKIFGA